MPGGIDPFPPGPAREREVSRAPVLGTNAALHCGMIRNRRHPFLWGSVGLLGSATLLTLALAVKPPGTEDPEPRVEAIPVSDIPGRSLETRASSEAEPDATEEPSPAPEPSPVVVPRPRTEEEAQVDLRSRAETRLLEGDLTGALWDLRGHVHDHPRTPDLLVRIARLAREQGQLDLAEAACRQALTADPERVDAPLELARIALAREAFDVAETQARRALSVDPDDAASWNLLGRAALGASQWQRAEFAFRRAVELGPDQGLYLNNLGLTYIYTRQGERAARALTACVEQMGEQTPAYVFNNLGLAHELRDELLLARTAFEDALMTDPSYVNAQVNLRRVDEALRRRAEVEANSVATEGPADEAAANGDPESPGPADPGANPPAALEAGLP